jgi:hypothetical protein
MIPVSHPAAGEILSAGAPGLDQARLKALAGKAFQLKLE